MAQLCGVREGDERERAITGEAARSALLLSLSLQMVLLVMTMTTIRLFWNPLATKPGTRGLFTIGWSFDPARHLDPFDASPASDRKITAFGAALSPKANEIEFGGYALSPSAFPVLVVLILLQLAAFRAFAFWRYEGEGD